MLHDQPPREAEAPVLPVPRAGLQGSGARAEQRRPQADRAGVREDRRPLQLQQPVRGPRPAGAARSQAHAAAQTVGHPTQSGPVQVSVPVRLGEPAQRLGLRPRAVRPLRVQEQQRVAVRQGRNSGSRAGDSPEDDRPAD